VVDRHKKAEFVAHAAISPAKACWDMERSSMGTRSIRLAAGLLLVAAAAGGALAQQPVGGRFTMHPADGGMLRLDTENGTMSMCKSRSGGQWQCETLPDERQALDKEIARLTIENLELQASVKRLEELAGIPQDKPSRGKGAGSGPGGMGLPGPEDVDKAMSYLQGMIKKFKEKLKEFEDLEGKPTQRL
jgi:hypothetical protein